MQIKKLCELQPGETCCVVGTLFKAMPLQPSILRELSEEVRLARSRGPPPECFTGSPCLSMGAGLQGHLTEVARDPVWLWP